MERVFDTVLSQYATAPTLTQIIRNLNDAIDPAPILDEFYNKEWNVLTAQGYGLDVWGRIVAVGRVFQVSVDEFFGFDEETLGYAPFNQGRFYGGGEVSTNFRLDDEGYRTLILAKAFANISNGSIPALTQVLRLLFDPHGTRGDGCWAHDNGDMSVSLVFTFSLTPVERAIILQSGVFPKPSGISYNLTKTYQRGRASMAIAFGMRRPDPVLLQKVAFAMTFGMTAQTIKNPASSALHPAFGMTANAGVKQLAAAAFAVAGGMPLVASKASLQARAGLAIAGQLDTDPESLARNPGAAHLAIAAGMAPVDTTVRRGPAGRATLGMSGTLTATPNTRLRATAAFSGVFGLSANTLQVGHIERVYLASGTTTWTVPAGWTTQNAIIEAIGESGAAAAGNANPYRGGGGGQGGAYAKATSPAGINAGDVLAVQIGAGGTGTPTILRNSLGAIVVQADYGRSASGATGGTGTQTNIGSVAYQGGSGGNAGTGSNGGAGGGGGAAGPNGPGASGGVGTGGFFGGGGGGASGGSAGGAGTSTVAGAGGANSSGTDGGTAGISGGNGGAGIARSPIGGAGGGGGAGSGSGGAGAIGEEFNSSHGAGGGGGGGGGRGTTAAAGAGGAGGAYGGAPGGGGGSGSPAAVGAAGAAKPGLIAITWQTVGGQPPIPIGAAFNMSGGLSAATLQRLRATTALAGTFALTADPDVSGGASNVLGIFLNGTQQPTNISLPASNAGATIGIITVTTSSGAAYTDQLTLSGTDADRFTLTNNGFLPCSLVVGALNIGAGTYHVTINLPTAAPVRLNASAALAGAFGLTASPTITGGSITVTGIFLNGSQVTQNINLPASNASQVVGAVTVTTSSGAAYPNKLTLSGADAGRFVLSNNGFLPCNLVVGASSLTAGTYHVTITAV